MTFQRFAALTASFAFIAVLGHAETPATAPAPNAAKYFYVYAPKGSPEVGHYTPSGWMGDVGDLRYEETADPAQKTIKCAKVSYSAKRTKGAGWAGIYWQNPNNNWGSRAGGYNLGKFTKLTFRAKGAKGGEKVDAFKMGGIQGEFGDSDSAFVGPITLTNDWKTYTIDLTGKDLSRVIGGFCFALNADNNPEGLQLFLTDIRYEI